jgi:hypothetical protein
VVPEKSPAIEDDVGTTFKVACGFVVPIPRLPLEGIKTKVELTPIEVLTPEETDENPINWDVDALDGEIVLLRIPVKLVPSP